MEKQKVSHVRKTAKDLYTLLIEKGVKVSRVSNSRFQNDFKFEEELERYTFRAERGKRSEVVLYKLHGRTLQEKIKSLKKRPEYMFINPLRFYRTLLKEVKNLSEDKVIIGYPNILFSATYYGYHVYSVKNNRPRLSYLSSEEVDALIQTTPPKQVFGMVIKYPA